LQRLFGTEAIALDIWPRLFLGGLVFFLVVEAEKFFIRSFVLTRSQSAESVSRDRSAMQAVVTGQAAGLPNRWQALAGAAALAALIGGEAYVFWTRVTDDGKIAGADALKPVPREVVAPVSGRVVAILCQAGGVVEVGQVCAKLDPAPFEDEVARRKETLAQATQRQEASISAHLNAKRELERMQRRQRRGSTTSASLEQARVAVEQAALRVDDDRAAVEESRAAIAAAEAALAKVNVTAPIAGKVISTVDVGFITEAGKQPLFVIAPIETSPGK
jgi:multidrug efflux pump subunit AcrA (membrane-fusion protein)